MKVKFHLLNRSLTKTNQVCYKLKMCGSAASLDKNVPVRICAYVEAMAYLFYTYEEPIKLHKICLLSYSYIKKSKNEKIVHHVTRKKS